MFPLYTVAKHNIYPFVTCPVLRSPKTQRKNIFLCMKTYCIIASVLYMCCALIKEIMLMI